MEKILSHKDKVVENTHCIAYPNHFHAFYLHKRSSGAPFIVHFWQRMKSRPKFKYVYPKCQGLKLLARTISALLGDCIMSLTSSLYTNFALMPLNVEKYPNLSGPLAGFIPRRKFSITWPRHASGSECAERNLHRSLIPVVYASFKVLM